MDIGWYVPNLYVAYYNNLLQYVLWLINYFVANEIPYEFFQVSYYEDTGVYYDAYTANALAHSKCTASCPNFCSQKWSFWGGMEVGYIVDSKIKVSCGK